MTPVLWGRAGSWAGRGRSPWPGGGDLALSPTRQTRPLSLCWVIRDLSGLTVVVPALELQPASPPFMDARQFGVPGPVVSLQVCSCVPTPVQAKDSDDDDDVTVTVDRDRFMDEFFEQVGASAPSLYPYTGRPWVTTA